MSGPKYGATAEQPSHRLYSRTHKVREGSSPLRFIGGRRTRVERAKRDVLKAEIAKIRWEV